MSILIGKKKQVTLAELRRPKATQLFVKSSFVPDAAD